MSYALLTHRFNKAQAAFVEKQLNMPTVLSGSDRPSTEELSNAKILFVRSNTFVDEDLLRNAPKLELIATTTSGFDHIDVVETKERNIKCCFTPEAAVQSVTELTLFLMLGSLKRVNHIWQANAKGEWREAVPKSGLLSEMQIGIIGLGRIGSSVSQACYSLGSKVVAYDPFITRSSFERAHAESVSLNELLSTSDLISLHVPLTGKTKHLINSSTLELMNTEAILINTSRGAVVDDQALTKALKNGDLAGAGMDVFSTEPLPAEHPLRSLNQVIVTPHMGAHCESVHWRALEEACLQIESYLSGHPLQHPLPLSVDWV